MADCQTCGATACSACVLCVGSVCSVLEARHTERLRHIDAGEARARTSCSVIASRRTPQNCGQCICLEARHPAQRVRALVPQWRCVPVPGLASYLSCRCREQLPSRFSRRFFATLIRPPSSKSICNRAGPMWFRFCKSLGL